MRRLVLATLAALTACTIETGTDLDDLRLERADGSRIDMPPNTETFAYCEPYDPPNHDEAAIKIVRRSEVGSSRWYVSAVLDDVRDGAPQVFPISFSVSEPARGALLFVSDDKDDNEAASDQPDSTGTITFTSADCDGFVAFDIDATIGSEFGDGAPIKARGSFRAPVGSRPD